MHQIARMHQIRLCTNQLPFSKHLVLLFDEDDIYVNKMIGIENFFTDRSWKNGIKQSMKQQFKIPNVKVHSSLYFFLSCIYCFNKKLSINGSTQKYQKILLLITLCQASVAPFFQTNTAKLISTSYIQTFWLLNPAVSNKNGYGILFITIVCT